MFTQITTDVSLGPLDFNFDAPKWWYAIGLAISFIGVVGFLYFLRKGVKKGSMKVQRHSPWHYAGGIIAVYLIVVIPLLSKLHDSRGGGGGPPIIFVQPQDTFVGSDIVACIPDIESGKGIDLPGWTIVGPAVFNTPRAKYNALVRMPVGIDNFSVLLKANWKESRLTRHSESGTENVYRVDVSIPPPKILDRYGALYITGEKNKLSSSAMKREFGLAVDRCGGSSRFHDGSAGGILYNGANMVAGWFGKADHQDANAVQSLAVDKAYALANTLGDKSFNGKSALGQAREITRQGVKELILAMNQDKVVKLESEGYRIEVEVNFTDNT